VFLWLPLHSFLSNSRTGIIYNVTKSAVGVIINKKVGNRFIEKRVNLRVEHIKHSKCRDDFLRRVKDNAAAKLKAKADGTKVNLKRLPAQPRLARHVSAKLNTPVTLTPIPYDSKSDFFVFGSLKAWFFVTRLLVSRLTNYAPCSNFFDDNSPSVNVGGIDSSVYGSDANKEADFVSDSLHDEETFGGKKKKQQLLA